MNSKQFEIKIGVNSSGVVTGINSAIGLFQRLSSSVGSVFKGTLGAMGVASIIHSAIDLIKRAIEGSIKWGAEIEKSARENGIGVESFQELGAAARESSIDVAEATTAFKKLQVAQVEALKGNIDLQRAFQRRGISLAALRAMTPMDLYKTVGESFEKAAPSAQVTADAMALMGKSAEKMLGAFRGGFVQAMRDAEKLGEVLDEKTVAACVRADNAIARLSLQLKVKVAQMIPPLVDLGEQLMLTARATYIWGKAWAMAGGFSERAVNEANKARDKFFEDQTTKDKSPIKPAAKPGDASNVTSNQNAETMAKAASDKLLNIGGYRGGGDVARIPGQQLQVLQRVEHHLSRIAHYADKGFVPSPEVNKAISGIQNLVQALTPLTSWE